MSDLADQLAALPGFEQESGGESYGPCPLSCGDIVHVTAEGEAWCDGACSADDVTAALRRRVEGVRPCPEAKDLRHRQQGFCAACDLYAQAMRRQNAEELDRMADEAVRLTSTSMRVSGDYLFDLPTVAPVWGTPDELLAAEGQGWMIVGPDGTGKTSLACEYAKARLALPGWGGSIWGLPVKPLPPERSVYYLGMDRPRQMMEAFMRGVGPDLREELTTRLFVHRGPPPLRLSRDKGQEWLLAEVEETRAGLVVLDSRKDLSSTVDPVEVAGVARAVALLVALEVEVLVLAHPVKGRRNGPPSLEDVSGLRDVFSGLGSVVFLDGTAGAREINMHHVKPIREVVRPFVIEHDHRTGRSGRTGAITEVTKVERTNALEVAVALACIEANDGLAPAASMCTALNSKNLTRTLLPLVEAGVVEHNGLRGPRSGYRRGPSAL